MKIKVKYVRPAADNPVTRLRATSGPNWRLTLPYDHESPDPYRDAALHLARMAGYPYVTHLDHNATGTVFTFRGAR